MLSKSSVIVRLLRPYSSEKNCGNPESSRRGFTLVELLVVISVIALLLSIMMPALNQAKEIAKALVCGAQMRVYGSALGVYAADNDGYFPYYAALNLSGGHHSVPEVDGHRPDLTWFCALADAVGGVTVPPSDPASERRRKHDLNAYADFRKCPGGQKTINVAGNVPPAGYWDAWIGINYGGNGSPTSNVPWVYRRINDPGFKTYDIRNPADCISFLDTRAGWGIYSPAIWKFVIDWDGDGKKDTNDYPYNWGAPKIHSDKFNTVMCDGHLKKMTFETFQLSSKPKNNHIWRFR